MRILSGHWKLSVPRGSTVHKQVKMGFQWKKVPNKGCVFLGESKNGFVISDHTDRFFTTKKKPEDSIRIIYHYNGTSSCSS